MILLSSLPIMFLLIFPFVVCALKKTGFSSKQGSSKKKTDSGSGSTDQSSNPDATDRAEKGRTPDRTPMAFKRVLPSFPPTPDSQPAPPPPPAFTPRKTQFPITKPSSPDNDEAKEVKEVKDVKSLKEVEEIKEVNKVKEVKEVKKPLKPEVRKVGTLRNHREKEKKMQISQELAPKEPKKKQISKTTLAKKSEYVEQKDEVDAKDQKSPSIKRHPTHVRSLLELMPTQMESVRADSRKDTLARRNREKVKNGEINENSDDTFEDAPSLPKKPCPSYDQLVGESGESPKNQEKNKKKKEN